MKPDSPYSFNGYIFELNQIYSIYNFHPLYFWMKLDLPYSFNGYIFFELNQIYSVYNFHRLYFWMKIDLPYSCSGYIFEWNQIYRTVWMAIFLNWTSTILITYIFEWNQIHRTVSPDIFFNETRFTVQLHRLYFWMKPDLPYSLNGYILESNQIYHTILIAYIFEWN